MSYFNTVNVQAANNATIDAFGRLRVSNPVSLFDSNFIWDLAPLLFDQQTSGSASISWDSTNSLADMKLTGGSNSGSAVMQSFQYHRYQSGHSQLVLMTFTMGAPSASVVKQVGYGDGTNGFYFEQSGSNLNFRRMSGTLTGGTVVSQSAWNIDHFDGTGPSGVVLNPTASQILIIDGQWLGVGRVRMGFDVNGLLYPAHEFDHANSVITPYVKTFSLPVQAKIYSTAAVASEFKLICSSVQTEGGTISDLGYDFALQAPSTASAGIRTHVISIQPSASFDGLTNRTLILPTSIDFLAYGANTLWELCIGVTLTGQNAFTASYSQSAVIYNTAGTYGGQPTAVIANGVVTANPAGGGRSTSTPTLSPITTKYPITLDMTGSVRPNGRLTLLATCLDGANSPTSVDGCIAWKEYR